MNPETVPFAYDGKTPEPCGPGGRNFTVYRVSIGGLPYAYKEMRPDSLEYGMFGHDPLLVASIVSRVYTIAKRQYRDRLAESRYFVAADSSGEDTVTVLQTYIEGRSLQEIAGGPPDDGRGYYRDTVRKFQNMWYRVRSDPEWLTLPFAVRDFYREHDIIKQNIIRTPYGKHILVDF